MIFHIRVVGSITNKLTQLEIDNGWAISQDMLTEMDIGSWFPLHDITEERHKYTLSQVHASPNNTNMASVLLTSDVLRK